MVTANLAHAEVHPGEGLDKVEQSEPGDLTGHGRPEASVAAKQLPRSLAAFRATRAGWRKSSAHLLREMRDESL